MDRLHTVALTLVTLAIALPAGLATQCAPSTSTPEVDLAPYYVDNDLCQPECAFSVWVYEESNGIEGLQRGDEGVDDTCGGMIESDTILF